MMTDQATVASESSDDFGRRMLEANARSRALARRLSETAGRIVATELEVARVHEQVAQAGISVVAAQAAEHAVRARRFAERERREQEKWAQWAAIPAPTAPSGNG